ncbi:cytochrome P450 [Cognatishimia sp. SS12]|uniref:cytochrome P450 n=1 Tax=Cognatishimia sp. SS12 TaxID=2979465 RepID=UPI00232FD82B|nr:cytochrome P450 [Cognatishimia sp. SS12]MDC0737379.1 cytochrome P450 [Cognatishimia sp. SS12]
MKTLQQSPTDPDFVQNPYRFYDRARQDGAVHFWDDYGMPAAFSYSTVSMLLKDRRLGREIPADQRQPPAQHTAAFYAVEAHSMLELEPPRHTRLRGLVMRAFTSRRIQDLGPEIRALCRSICATFPSDPFDLIDLYASEIPVIVIARLLGVPEDMRSQLLSWSHAMVGMYQAARTPEMEYAAAEAAQAFSDFLRGYIDLRRSQPGDDLISELIAAEEDGTQLSTEELISTCILLLNAGHEASVHTLGNAVKTLLETGADPARLLTNDRVATTVEELIRYDPPLHMFTRYAYDTIEVNGVTLKPGDQIALMLGAANRDPAMWEAPGRFNPDRPIQTNMAFGAGRHFCIGAALARLELQIALQVLFESCPKLTLTEPPRYANIYHFHGLNRLMVQV